jgi:hypothetical protein
VYAAVVEGETLHKERWSRTLQHGGKPLALAWSRDFYGMTWAMPFILVLLLATALFIPFGPHWSGPLNRYCLIQDLRPKTRSQRESGNSVVPLEAPRAPGA